MSKIDQLKEELQKEIFLIYKKSNPNFFDKVTEKILNKIILRIQQINMSTDTPKKRLKK